MAGRDGLLDGQRHAARLRGPHRLAARSRADRGAPARVCRRPGGLGRPTPAAAAAAATSWSGPAPISRTRSMSCAAAVVWVADATAITLRSALRVAAANGVRSSRASATAMATISAAVKLTGGSVIDLSMA